MNRPTLTHYGFCLVATLAAVTSACSSAGSTPGQATLIDSDEEARTYRAEYVTMDGQSVWHVEVDATDALVITDDTGRVLVEYGTAVEEATILGEPLDGATADGPPAFLFASEVDDVNACATSLDEQIDDAPINVMLEGLAILTRRLSVDEQDSVAVAARFGPLTLMCNSDLSEDDYQDLIDDRPNANPIDMCRWQFCACLRDAQAQDYCDSLRPWNWGRCNAAVATCTLQYGTCLPVKVASADAVDDSGMTATALTEDE